MKKNAIAIALFALALFAFLAPQAGAQIQEANLYSLGDRENADIKPSRILSKGTMLGTDMSQATGFYEYQDVYIVYWTNKGAWDSPDKIGPVYYKDGTRGWPNFAAANGPVYIGNNVASIKTSANQTVYILTWRNASLLTLGSTKTRLLIIRPNSHVDFNQKSWGRTGFILQSGTIDEDTNIKTASKLDEAMSMFSLVMDYDWYYLTTRTVDRIKGNNPGATKDQLADMVINDYATRGAAVAALVSAGPIWMLPAEFAHSFAQNVIKAQMAYALAMVYGKTPKDTDEFKFDLYLLFSDDDVQMTLSDFAKEAGISGTVEVLSKESVLTMVKDSKAFQKTVKKIATNKVTARLTVKGIAKHLPRLVNMIGVSFTAKEARDFGAQAKAYYGGSGTSFINASGAIAAPANLLDWIGGLWPFGKDKGTPTKADYQAFIQAQCSFSNPANVWTAIDTHTYADSVYKTWAESYPNLVNRRFPYAKPANKTDKEIIQKLCKFSNPNAVWDAVDKHSDPDALLRVWAGSYYNSSGILTGIVGAVRTVRGIIPSGTPGIIPSGGDGTPPLGGVTPARTPTPAPAPTPTPTPTPAPSPTPAPTSGGPSTWTAVSNSTFGDESINAIAYGGGKFVAVGTGGKMAYSTNGQSWTAVSNSTFSQWEFDSIAYGGGRFVAGASSMGGGKIAYSADGISWTAAANSGFPTTITTTILDIAYGGNRFVAVGNGRRMASSTNGQSWTAVADTKFRSGVFEIYGVAWGGGRFVAGGNQGEMAYSADGTNWTVVSRSPFAPQDMLGIAYGGDRFVAGGGFGKIAYSTDGASWTTGANGIFGSTSIVHAIAYGNNRFVAVGTGGRIAYSADGTNWTTVSNSAFGSSSIYAVAYGGGRFVAGGVNGKIAYANW